MLHPQFRTILITGPGHATVASLLTALLGTADGWRVIDGDLDSGVFAGKHADIAVVLPLAGPADSKVLGDFLRTLDHRRGMLVAYGKDGIVRKGCRGFGYRFRWVDDRPWPGTAWLRLPDRERLFAATAARVAHEVGMAQEPIKRCIASFDFNRP